MPFATKLAVEYFCRFGVPPEKKYEQQSTPSLTSAREPKHRC
jgi:hypothetical protein